MIHEDQHARKQTTKLQHQALKVDGNIYTDEQKLHKRPLRPYRLMIRSACMLRGGSRRSNSRVLCFLLQLYKLKKFTSTRDKNTAESLRRESAEGELVEQPTPTLTSVGMLPSPHDNSRHVPRALHSRSCDLWSRHHGQSGV